MNDIWVYGLTLISSWVSFCHYPGYFGMDSLGLCGRRAAPRQVAFAGRSLGFFLVPAGIDPVAPIPARAARWRGKRLPSRRPPRAV